LLTIEEGLAVIEQLLPQRCLNKVQEIILRSSWAERSYDEIAKASGYDYGYIKDTGSKLWQLLTDVLGEKVTKLNIKGVLQRYVESRDLVSNVHVIQNLETQTQIDWGEAIDVSFWCDRTFELSTLQQWVIQDKCRVVTLLGMGGIGKTALSVKFTQLVQANFDFVIWRSLRDTPTLDDLLTNLIKFISQQQEVNLPEKVGAKISLLITYLRKSKCLLALDNFDALLSSGKRAGLYRDGYEEYGELLQRIGETAHQSCLLLTSREKPAEVAALQGDILPVRVLQLDGLSVIAAQNILKAKGLFATEIQIEQLVASYRGNPLALKIAATSIVDLFSGNIHDFLQQKVTVFNGIRHLLNCHFQRLSPLEERVLYWLAINREPVQTGELETDIIPAVLRANLLETLESLTWRCLVEKSQMGFTQQPVVMEYVTDKLIEQVSEEIITGEVNFLHTYSLIKATAKDYIRKSQIRVIVEPLLNNLLINLKSNIQVKSKIDTIVLNLQLNNIIQPSYCAGNLINLLIKLNIDLTGYNFANLSIWQAYLQDTNLHNVNFNNSDISKSIFREALPNILWCEFHPDGNLLATSDANGKVSLWDIKGTEIHFIMGLQGHIGLVWAARFSPDGHKIASCGEDGTIKIWNVQTGQCLQAMEGHSMRCESICFSPDGNFLVSGSADKTIKLWDINTGQCLKIFTGHTNILRCVVFSPDGTMLATGSEDYTVKIWHVDSGECLCTLHGHTDVVWSVAFCPNPISGDYMLASGSADRTVNLWCVSTGKLWKTLKGSQIGIVCAIAWSRDGETLAVAGEASAVSLWDIHTGQCLQLLGGYTRRIWSVAFHPSNNILVTVGRDQCIKLWHLKTGKCLRILQGYTGRVWSVVFSPDGKFLASAVDQTVQLWDGLNQKYNKALCDHNCEVSTVVFCQNQQPENEQILASGSYDRTIKIWNASKGQCLRTLEGHTGFVFSLAANPDGKTIASSGADHTIKIWNVNTGQCLKTLEAHTGWIFSLAWSSDGKILASGSADGSVKLWDTQTWECMNVLQGHQGWVYSVDFSPDNQMLVSGGSDLNIRLWNIKTANCLKVLPGHTKMITRIKFSRLGNIIVSASYDLNIKIWDFRTGECLNTIQGHENWILEIAFYPDGKTLASASQDQTIKFWDVETGNCTKVLRSPRPYEGMDITNITGLTTAQKETLKALGAFENPQLPNKTSGSFAQ
jgi:WD40 repeat protein